MAKKKKALICGVSGQDGAYLARFLIGKGYKVYGTSRDAQMANFARLKRLGILNSVQVESCAINDFRSVLQTMAAVRPDEIYDLAGQSSVGLSFNQPVETLESISLGTLNLLEAIRFLKLPAKFYNAGSGECFGDTYDAPAHEADRFKPRSPYGVAKAAAFWEVTNYREAYGLYACAGILFNHESPLRHERFVTRKIVAAARRIAQGSREKLRLGNLSIRRDWGWAPEYIEAMWLILQQSEPDDFVIATGEHHSLEDFLALAFAGVDLDWHNHVDIDQSLLRPSDISISYGNPNKAAAQLGWRAQYKLADIVRLMLEAETDGKVADIL